MPFSRGVIPLNPTDPHHDTDDIPSLEDTHAPAEDTATSMFLSHPSKAASKPLLSPSKSTSNSESRSAAPAKLRRCSVRPHSALLGSFARVVPRTSHAPFACCKHWSVTCDPRNPVHPVTHTRVVDDADADADADADIDTDGDAALVAILLHTSLCN